MTIAPGSRTDTEPAGGRPLGAADRPRRTPAPGGGMPLRAADRPAWTRILADVSVVTVTPFSPDLRGVDHAGLKQNLERLIRGGVQVLVAGGNTGEFAALSQDEAVEITRTHARVAR